MVDVHRRLTALNPAHIAGLRRLSARAASVSTTTTRLLTFSSLAAVRFWSDAAVVRRRRGSSSPKWVEEYIGQMRSVLREGGWSESDISEMVQVSGSAFFTGDIHALLLKADSFSHSLRKSGWSSQEVSDALGFGERLGKLAESVSRS